MSGPTSAEADSYALDLAQIEDLLGRYQFALDYDDFEAYAGLFTEDAVLEFARGTVTGRASIKQAAMDFKQVIKAHYRREDGKVSALRHVKAHMTARIEGDRAWTTNFWFEMADNGPGNSLKMGTFGVNKDELRRIDGLWYLSKRVVLNEFLPGRGSGDSNPVAAMDAFADAALA